MEGELDSLFQTLVPIALALLLSLACGRAAARVGIPRVTIYLLVGFALGPHALLRLLPPESPAAVVLLGPASETALDVIAQLAIGFILFGIGGAFRFDTLRREGPRVVAVSALEIGCTGLLVAGAVFAGTGDWRLAAIAPALAVASAPSATLVTLREVEAEGPATRCLVLFVGNNNLVALLGFPVLLSLTYGAGGALWATASAGLALAGGAILGFAVAVALESVTDRRDLVLLGIMLVLAALGFAHGVRAGSTGLAMLSCFAAGVLVSNASPHWDALSRYLENTVYPLYVLFFVGAGSDLHVEALAQAGLLGASFILARAAGKMAGVFAGIRLARWTDVLPSTLGAGLLCQAGVALGLVTALEAVAPGASADLRNVVVASVVVFELLGPWLVRQTVVRAGEVTLASLVPHVEAKGAEAVRWVSLELRRNLGLLPVPEDATDTSLRVRHAVRRRPATVAPKDSFERVMKALGATGADHLPVVDGAGSLRGLVSYDEVKNALYDPALLRVVICQDLTSPVDDPLEPDDPLPLALERMDEHRVHSWPVVEDGRLLGMVRRSDVYSLMRRRLSPRSRGAAGARPAR